MPRGGRREGAGRKKLTIEQIYQKTYENKLNKVREKAGDSTFSSVRKVSFENFKASYNIAKVSNPDITPEKFVNNVIKNNRERTLNQARAQSKNIREHIKRAKVAAKQGQQLSSLDQVFSTLNEKDFTSQTLYQGSAQTTFLEQLASQSGNNYGDVFGS